ncbi:MAG TPA: DUF1761 domain-containing protein [Bacteroidia bacterium]|nr:DUF1761 domain-containing protein [Bacteroidia bacterium]
MHFFSHANWLAIGVSVLVYYGLGALWFSVLFGKPWMAGHNIQMPTDEAAKKEMRKKMPVMMLITLVMNIAMAMLIGFFVMALGAVNCMAGIKVGLALSAVACIPFMMSHLYLMKPFKVWVIDAGYHIVAITVMSIIISVWH